MKKHVKVVVLLMSVLITMSSCSKSDNKSDSVAEKESKADIVTTDEEPVVEDIVVSDIEDVGERDYVISIAQAGIDSLQSGNISDCLKYTNIDMFGKMQQGPDYDYAAVRNDQNDFVNDPPPSTNTGIAFTGCTITVTDIQFAPEIVEQFNAAIDSIKNDPERSDAYPYIDDFCATSAYICTADFEGEFANSYKYETLYVIKINDEWKFDRWFRTLCATGLHDGTDQTGESTVKDTKPKNK